MVEVNIKKLLKKFLNFLKIISFIFGIFLILGSIRSYIAEDYILATIILLIGFALSYKKGKELIIKRSNRKKQLLEEKYKKLEKLSLTEIDNKIRECKPKKTLLKFFARFFTIFILSFIFLIIGYNLHETSIRSFWIGFGIAMLFYLIEEKTRREHLKYLQKIRDKVEVRIKKEREEQKEKGREIKKFEEKQRKKGLVKFEDKWGTPEQIKKWKEVNYGIDKNFMNLSHFQFEKFVAELFEKMGYNTTVTRKTGDFGVDVIAKDKHDTIAIQVKQNRAGNNVSNIIVQNILGSMWKVKANKSIIITTSDFTVQAKEQAQEAPVELWNLRTLKQIVRKYFIEQ